MRTVNLRSIVIVNKHLSVSQRDDLFKHWGISPKPEELKSLECFGSRLLTSVHNNTTLMNRLLDGCFFGFSIPHIAKEFDCLWIGDKTIVNLELKSQNKEANAIMKQLIQNQYYLHHLPQTIKSYTFIASTKDCFTLDSNSNLIITPFKEVTSALVSIHQESLVLDEIESLFPPEKFLVSPFNSPHQFKEGHYFLTNPQRKIKADILRFVEDSNRGCFCALTGGPGTGKSLLLYDIAHTLKREGKRIMIGHCGALNAGHGELIKNGWPIKLTMDLVSKRNDKWTIVDDEVDVFLIDEAQRCYDYVMDSLVEWLVQVGKKCVFSYDADQVMSIDEQRRMNSTRIEELAKDNKFCLSSNIRTNASVYGFVRALFNKRHAANGFARDHIRISFCRTIEQAKDMLNTLKEYGYCVPKFTPMMHYIEEYESWFPGDSLSAHGVIGQEFDVVVGLLSENLYYDDDDQLASHGRYHYLEVRMLYQILTRARDKIHLVIVNNATILERCMKLLKG